ncbi:hypothetical protein PENTCL1PPCAC_15957, partial [Pristionchus entomophagus]
SRMGIGMLLQPLFLLFLAQGIGAYVYSCSEMRYKLLNSNITFNTKYICVVTQEGFTNWDQLKQIKLDKYPTNLDDVVKHPSSCVSSTTPNLPWKFTASDLKLECTQEFSVILFSKENSIITPLKEARPFTVQAQSKVLAVPQTDMWIRTKGCTGKGNVRVFTGAGKDNGEEQYLMGEWPCESMPDWIFTYDNVITIQTDATVTYTAETSNFLGTYLPYSTPVFIKPCDRIVVLTSGRSSGLLNSRGAGDFYVGAHRAYMRISTTDEYDVIVNMQQVSFDSRNTGSVDLKKYFNGPTFKFYNGTYTEKFTTKYFEVRYVPKQVPASEVRTSQDNVVMVITVGCKANMTWKSTTTTTNPTTQTITTTSTKLAPSTTTAMTQTTTTATPVPDELLSVN